MWRGVFRHPFFAEVLSVRNVHHCTYKNRRTGRSSGNCVLPSQAWRYQISLGRTFQRSLGKRVGFEINLSDKILLASLGQRYRRLDEKKIQQLSEILRIKVEEAAGMNEVLSKLSLQFHKLKVNSSFTEVVIHWFDNDSKDENVQQMLDNEKHILRKAISEGLGTSCPQLCFVQDKSNLLAQEMDELFKSADYGVDYRSLSIIRRQENVEDRQHKPVKTNCKPPSSWKHNLIKK